MTTKTPKDLSRTVRFFSISAALFLLGISCLSYIPFVALLLTPLTGPTFPEKFYESAAHGLLPDALAATTFASAVLLLLFGLNGYRILSAKLPGGGEFYATQEKLSTEAPLDKGISDEAESKLESSPAPTNSGEPLVEKPGFAIYKISDVELDVVQRLLSANRSEVATMPRTLGEIEYVYRKDGPGNPRWYFKLKDKEKPLVLVSGKGGNPNKII